MAVSAMRKGGAPASLKTGNSAVDRLNDDAFVGPGHPGDDTSLQDLYAEALTKGQYYSVGRAVQRLGREKRLDGFEAEVDAEMAKRMGRKARGFFVPWDAPIPAREARSLTISSGVGAVAAQEARGLTTNSGPGSITAQIPYMLLIDVLRPKLVMARLGARVLNILGSGPAGNVQLSTKSAAASVSWVAEGAPAPSQSNMTVQSFNMKPYTATAFSNVTRRMIKLGAPGFEDHVIDDIMTGIAVAVDGAALNGNNLNMPLGLFQFAGLPSIGAHGDTGNGGTITYSNLVAMNQTVGLFNGDSPLTARLGWVTSPQGKATLLLTDKSATVSTGRYCWETHPMLVDGQVVTVDSVLGSPAVATTNAPSALTEGSSTTVTSLAHGNFDDCWINLFSGFDCIVNPFLQSTAGIVQISGFQDVDVRFVRPSSFVVCPNILPIVPQTS
jgi:HK97 family phage major capsid protein